MPSLCLRFTVFAFRVRACRPERPQSTGTAIHHALFSAKHFCKFMRMHVKSQPDARKPRRTTQALDPTPLRLETPTSPPPPAPPPQKNGQPGELERSRSPRGTRWRVRPLALSLCCIAWVPAQEVTVLGALSSSTSMASY